MIVPTCDPASLLLLYSFIWASHHERIVRRYVAIGVIVRRRWHELEHCPIPRQLPMHEVRASGLGCMTAIQYPRLLKGVVRQLQVYEPVSHFCKPMHSTLSPTCANTALGLCFYGPDSPMISGSRKVEPRRLPLCSISTRRLSKSQCIISVLVSWI